jgi:beta-ketodecanoyl-[acyl-carrier-protein] synthase
MTAAVIRSTGLWTPDNSITNEELVDSFNAYVERNITKKHARDIEAG